MKHKPKKTIIEPHKHCKCGCAKGSWFFVTAFDYYCMKGIFDKREKEGYSDYIVIIGKPGGPPCGGPGQPPCH